VFRHVITYCSIHVVQLAEQQSEVSYGRSCLLCVVLRWTEVFGHSDPHTSFTQRSRMETAANRNNITALCCSPVDRGVRTFRSAHLFHTEIENGNHMLTEITLLLCVVLR